MLSHGYKVNLIKRWLPIENYLKNKWSLYVHFSNWHINYYTAWLYTTKEDRNYIQSPDHRDLANSGPQRTTSASQARKKNEVYQPSQVATVKNLPVPQAEKKARVKKTKETKVGRQAKQLSESILGI